MFKLVVLSAFFAVVAARPGHIESPALYSTSVVQEPVLTKIGEYVHSVPSSVSHQSQSVIHSHAHIIEDIHAPVLKTTTYHAAPVVHSYEVAAPVYKTIVSPVVHEYASIDSHSSW